MLSKILNTSKLIFAVTYTKYNSSISSYVRFLAKNYKFKHKNINRLEKVWLNNKELSNILKGPVHIFYANNDFNIQFISDIENITEIAIVFIMYNNTIILSNNCKFDKNILEYKTNVVLSLKSIFNKISIDAINYKIVSLIYAYSQSIIKRN